MIYYLPLEHLDTRYTTALDAQLRAELDRQGKTYVALGPRLLTDDVPDGAFLNAPSTICNKMLQIGTLARTFHEGEIEDGDTIFISDLWMPGLSALPYLAYFCDRKIRIAGLMHAGSWTETDFVATLAPWAADLERSWLQIVDQVFLGSNWIRREMVDKGRVTRYDNLHVTGLPFDPEACYQLAPYRRWEDKEDIVVFNGRLADEKQPWLFDVLARRLGERAKFVKTMECGLSKREYYDLLSRAKVCVSFALQENFGYGCLEAAAYGCAVVVPDRLAYPEFYPDDHRYERFDEAVHLTQRFLQADRSEVMREVAYAQRDNVTKIVEAL